MSLAKSRCVAIAESIARMHTKIAALPDGDEKDAVAAEFDELHGDARVMFEAYYSNISLDANDVTDVYTANVNAGGTPKDDEPT